MQEVPPPLDPNFNGMRTVLRIGVPVFVSPGSVRKARIELKWHATAASDGQIRLSLANSGTAHVKITDLELTAANGTRSSGVQRMSTYVLPGHAHEWLLKIEGGVKTGATLRVRAHADSLGDQTANLTVDAS
jgi:P pilus assembly chaperone PapD